MISIRNAGQDIVSTDYWDTEHAHVGLLYLSANAGALRLLVPPEAEQLLGEMRTSKSVSIEPSLHVQGHIDVVFEDGTDSPFSVALSPHQVDRKLSARAAIPFTVWTRAGRHLSLTARIVL